MNKPDKTASTEEQPTPEVTQCVPKSRHEIHIFLGSNVNDERIVKGVSPGKPHRTGHEEHGGPDPVSLSHEVKGYGHGAAQYRKGGQESPPVSSPVGDGSQDGCQQQNKDT